MSVGPVEVQAVESIVLGRPGYDWFTCRLLQLMAKADSINLERLRLGFPDEVALFEWYKAGQPGEWEAFRRDRNGR